MPADVIEAAPPDTARWVSREYVAQAFDVSTKTVDRWAKAGYGPQRHCMGPGERLVRYLKCDVDSWMPPSLELESA